VWAFEIEYVPALNITRFYSDPVEHAFALPGGGPADLYVYWGGELIARAKADASGAAKLPLARGCQFDVVARKPDGSESTHSVKP
jgi:hypothetical protein